MSSVRTLGPISVVLSACIWMSAGCRSDPNPPQDPDGSTTADSPPPVGCDSENTIQELQDVSMPAGTPVALCNVVVVAIDRFGDRQGGVYVMEPEGGPFSGVFVFLADPNA